MACLLRSARRANLQPGAPGFVYKELMRKGWGVWVGPTNDRLFKLDFPSAKFWVKIFFLDGWISEPKDPPPLL